MMASELDCRYELGAHRGPEGIYAMVINGNIASRTKGRGIFRDFYNSRTLPKFSNKIIPYHKLLGKQTHAKYLRCKTGKTFYQKVAPLHS